MTDPAPAKYPGSGSETLLNCIAIHPALIPQRIHLCLPIYQFFLPERKDSEVHKIRSVKYITTLLRK